VDAINASITKLQSEVKLMKKSGASPEALTAKATEMEKLKVKLSSAQTAQGPKNTFPRKAFDDTLVRKMFVIPSFEIHGGVKGLFDLGPPACGLKANVIDTWRKHFVLEENMLEMECTNLTPKCVLETSGHVDKFTDMMVKDVETGECFRADKLLEDFIDELIDANPDMPAAEVDKHRLVQRQADSYSLVEIHALFQDYGIKGEEGHDLSKPFDFNLMFETRIGPEGTSVGYLRPETAQGLFVNFRRLLEFNGKRMPFAAAQVGLGFRNEIAPRGGLLRVREFCMAEIEHFVNPADKSHPSFKNVAGKVMNLFDQTTQLGTGKHLVMSIGDAVTSGTVNNETLGYFMARTQLFMEKIGMDPTRLRFRQHLATEMAHYATDCWDCEINTSYGWIECVGHADRACYDLMVHAKATNTSMTAAQRLDEPKMMEFITVEPDKKVIGKTFKGEQKKVIAALSALAEDDEEVTKFEAALSSAGSAAVEGGFVVTQDMVKFVRSSKEVQEVKFLPSVIEPSFGMGRILYALLEHSFSQDPADEQRVVMRFNPRVAPTKCNVYPLQTNEKFGPIVQRIAQLLTAAGLTNKVDASGQSIGRRYARADEVGTPFGITVDFDTIDNDTVTLRERDTQAQVRLPIAQVAEVVRKIADGSQPWPEVQRKYDEKANDEEDEMDLGFGDDDDDDDDEEAAAAPSSRQAMAAKLKAENEKKLEEAKAAALARLAKKEANQRSLCNLEIKPWGEEQDLLALFAKIKKEVVRDGLKWSEGCNLVEVAFGIKKIICTAIIPVSVSMDEIIDEMTEDTFADEIQSMNMTSMSLL